MRRNLAVANIAGELKISSRFLEAIEAEDFSKLPGGVFTKSFVRQYAAYLGVDPEEMAAEVQRMTEPVVLLPEEGNEKLKPDVPNVKIEHVEEWRSVADKPPSVPSWLKSGALLVVLMLGCSVVYWWWERSHNRVIPETQGITHVSAATPQSPPATVPPLVEQTPAPSPSAPTATDQAPVTQPAATQPVAAAPVASQPAPAQSATVAPVTTPAGAPVGTTPATATPAATTPPAAPKSDIPVATPNPNATVHVVITADEQVWMRAEVNGKYQFAGTLQPHESRSIDADGEVKVRFGNAGGVTVLLNGKPVTIPGAKGQIRTVQFTSGGFQIVSPPKSLEPLDRL